MTVMTRRAQERLEHNEKRLERRDKILRHDRANERATVEEVFDQTTRLIVFNLLKTGLLYEVNGVISSGKEARVYGGKNKEGLDFAVKIYLTSSAEFKKGILKYIEGDPRFKSVKRDTRSLFAIWAQKEFRNLEEALQAKVNVPKPLIVKSNVLVMEFIGKDGKSAPSLKEAPPENPERIYKLLITNVKRLYQKAKIVHGDLSEYNILMWKNKPIIIDMSQSVSIEHPLANFMLTRDLNNLNRFFSKLNVNIIPVEELQKQIVGKKHAKP
ncbi:MAG: serine protein kinase RIO [Candidatus Bathyarchaeota archaeon]|nr:serine protein kinase RIO [Candidatus Termiticorpusculum sp.]MCL2869025.1 serine protein kinase RIO [Candidatus Termiticorpusculum sp.]